ncbi:hypothetical protein C8Q76DRAFT_309185 [Earliella scabrosa]|nr:hypothetical protein C8Q76DRAFT_309185 [Earliella scabrosa]
MPWHSPFDMNGTTAVNIAEMAAPSLIGELLNWGLAGALTVQVYLYHILFPEDPLHFRLFVYAVFAVEWVQTGLVAQNSLSLYVYHFGDVDNLNSFGNAWFSVPVITGVVSIAVQLFYARRIWALGRSKVLVAVICLAVIQSGAAIASGIMIKNMRRWHLNPSKTTPAIAVWLGGSALVDIIIAVAMTVLLLKSKTGIRHSDAVVDKLVRIGIESGAITATIAVVDVILYAAVPGNLYRAPAPLLAKLYANMLLTSLNNRAFLRKVSVPHTMQEESVLARAFTSRLANGGGATEAAVRVEVLTETTVDRDTDYAMKKTYSPSGPDAA